MKTRILKYSLFSLFLILNGTIVQAATLALTAWGSAGNNGLTASSYTSPTTPQNGVVLYGIEAQATGGSTTITKFIMQYSSAAFAGMFSNTKLYASTSSTFSTGTATQIAGAGSSGTASTSGNVITFTGFSNTVASAGTEYYYLVADYTSGSVQTGPAISGNTIATYNAGASTAQEFTGSAYDYYTITVTFASNSGTTNGINSTVLNYGDSGVVFAFSVTTPSSLTVNTLYISATGTVGNYFSSGTMYVGSSPNFASATAIPGTFNMNAGTNLLSFTPTTGINNSNTTEYYFLSLNYNQIANADATMQFSLSNAQTSANAPVVQTTPSASFTTSTTYTGPTLNLGITADWNGQTSSDVSVASNYDNLNGGVLTTVPSQYDQVRVGVATYSNMTGTYNQPAMLYSGYTFTAAQVVVGSLNTPMLTIASGATVNIIGNFSVNSSSTVNIIGPGILTIGGNLTMGGTTFTQTTAPVTIAGNFTNTGTYNQTSTGSLTVTGTTTNSGTITLNTGTSAFGNTVSNTGTITQSGAGTLNISGTTTNNSGGLIKLTAGTVNFAALTNSSGATITQTGGNLSVTGNYTNSGTYTTGTGSAAFSGSTMTDNSSGGTTFKNVSFSGTNTMSGTGGFSVSSTGILTMNTSSSLATNGVLTLISDASGSATVAQLPSTTPMITGTVKVQRYIAGGSISDRGYRLLSSPVYDNTSTPASTKYSNLSFVQNTNSWTSGLAGGGFDATGTASMYLYDESHAAIGGSFYRAINKINNTTAYNIGTTEGTFGLPVGNGIFYFFRGNKSTTATVVPSNVTLVYSGALNQGQVTVNDWYNSSSTNLSYTTGTTATGFNLVGNPYASSIDWNTAYNNATSTSGVYAPSVSHSIYIYNPTTQNYSVWTSTSATGGIASGSAGASNIIPAGQGFFVQATSSSAKVVFNESAKVSSQPATLLLYASLPRELFVDQHLRLQLSKDQDSIDLDQTVIIFNDQTGSTTFNPVYDAPYLPGSGILSLANVSSDNVPVALKQMAFPKSSQTIPLKFTVKTDGLYHLNMTQVVNIPSLYDVWLMDNYKHDSLDIKHNPAYAFNVIHSDTASISIKRFSLIIRQNPAYAYNLITFNGAKVTGGAQLTWQTNNDQNYFTYVLQKSTDKGKTFTSIDSLLSSNAGTYTFTDKKPVNGLNEYRLEQINSITDTAYFTKLIPLQYTAPGASIGSLVSVYPNPAVNMITLAINDTTNTAPLYNIKIINMSGSIIRSVTSNQPNWQSDVSALLPGTYFIEVINNSNSTLVGQSKFIKL